MTRRRPLSLGIGLGAAGGAALAATAVTPLVVWNGPVEALLVYPPLLAVPGAAVGGVAGGVAALVGAWFSARPSGAAAATGTASPGSSRAPGR